MGTRLTRMDAAASIRDAHAVTVIATAALLGASAGAVGTTLTLRRQALVGDAVGHATLPGLAGAALASVLLGGSGRELWVLLPGAALGACAGIACVHILRRHAGLAFDAAMAVTLSVLFGLGVMLLSMVQQVPSGHQAGLDGLLTGRAASLVTQDLAIAGFLAALTAAAFIALGRDIRALAFDEAFARMGGRPVRAVGACLSALVVMTVVAGTQAVGLVLVVALLVIPATAARRWSDRFGTVTVAASAIGAASAAAGAAASAMLPGMATGPLIVVAAACALALSVPVGALRARRSA